MHIHWFPGHMAKARRMIEENIKLVDVVIELLDARTPYSSSNQMIREIVGDKPKVIALNKADLAEPEWTTRWISHLRSQGYAVTALDAVTGAGAKDLVNLVVKAASDKMDRLLGKGIRPRAVRAMILGIPNVGKSSLINRLLGTATVRTADKPGVTRGKQWIKIGKNLELLDTPGVLWPRMDNQETAFKLAVTGAINDEVYDMEQVVLRLVELLRTNYPARVIARYKLSPPLPDDNTELLALIAAKRGCLRSGGAVDYDKTYKIILTEFRAGKLGPFTLDFPADGG